MDKSDSQKVVEDQIVDENPDELTVSISDNEWTIIIECEEYDAAYTADEARELARDILSTYHQRGWGENIIPTADYISDLADVVDNHLSIEDVKQKWNHNGTFGSGKQYEVIADTGEEPIMSFESKEESIRFCEDWNSRPSWVIEYHIETDGSPVAIWNLTESEGEMVAELLNEEITRLISAIDDLEWEISVKYQPEVPVKDGVERIFRVGIRNQNSQRERYRYQIYYSIDGKGINTLTQQSVNHARRVQIDQHRGRILEAMSNVPKRLGLYIGEPDADLEFLNLGSILSPDDDFP